jgi:hypothetical protein
MKVTIELEDEDLPYLKDVVFNATGYSYNKQEILHIWDSLPEDLQLEAAHWGLSDTVVRDNIYEHLEEKLKDIKK